MLHAVANGTPHVAFRSAKEHCFRGAKGNIGNRERCRLGTVA